MNQHVTSFFDGSYQSHLLCKRLILPWALICVCGISAAAQQPTDSAQTTGDPEIAAAITVDRARRAYYRKDLDEALRLYRVVRDEYAATRNLGIAQYNIAYILTQQGKYDEAIKEYQRLIKSDVNDLDPGSNIMEAYRNYRHRASLGIASCYELQGKFDKALEYLKLARDKHRYNSWCGTCASHSRQSLAERIEACLLRLGRREEVAESLLIDLKKSGVSPSDALLEMLDEIDAVARQRWKVVSLAVANERLLRTHDISDRESPLRHQWRIQYEFEEAASLFGNYCGAHPRLWRRSR